MRMHFQYILYTIELYDITFISPDFRKENQPKIKRKIHEEIYTT